MFIRKKESPHKNGRTSVQIVEANRKGNKVSQSIVRHVGTAHNDEELKDLLHLAATIKCRMEEEKQPSLPIFTPEQLVERHSYKETDKSIKVDLKKLREEQRFNEGVPEVFGALYKQLKFDFVFTGRFAETNNAILKSCVLARLANPSSKLRTSELLEEDFGVKLPVEKIYRMMTQLSKSAGQRLRDLVRESTLDLLHQKVDILLFDVTTLYFESFTPDDLRNFGFSKDCKFKETQVVLALITTPKGLPISYEVFPGNTMEMKTLIPSIKRLKEKYTLNDIDFAADRGMFSDQNLSELERENLRYVVGAKLKNMSKTMKENILQINKNNENNSFKTTDLDYKGRRLVISYCPFRASNDRKARERLVDRVKKIADKDGQIEVKKLVKNNGTNKFLTFESKRSAVIDDKKIKSSEQWDGITGYITNSKQSAVSVIKRYRSLWEIEESFRINKHDLKVRPIYHRMPYRIEAHLDICFLTYALARQLSYRYEVQQGERISFNQIRDELLRVQASVLVDTETKKRYVVPSKASPAAKKLYQVMGMKRSLVPYEIE